MRSKLMLVLGLAVLAGGCEELGPVASEPAAMEVVEGEAQSAAAGQAVSVAPAVRVVDEAGAPVADVDVAFEVVTGGGSVAGAEVVTDASGVARVGSWTLGTEVGENTLRATVQGLAPVVFTATAVAGGESAMAAVSGDGQSMAAFHAVADAPRVVVTDAHGNPVPGVEVVFAATTGGGAVTGATDTTDGSGNARPEAWQLGAAGEQTLTATVAGLSPVSFTATAVEPCDFTWPNVPGSTSFGTLSDVDCVDSAGRYIEYHDLVVTESSSWTLTMGSDDFPEFVGAYDAEGTFVVAQFTSTPGFTRAILAPGTYRVATRSLEAGVGGDYALTVATAPHDLDECDVRAFITAGVTFSGALTANDCTDDFGDAADRVDGYSINMFEGETYTITVNATGAFKLSLWDASGHQDLQSVSEAGTAQLTVAAETGGFRAFYVIGLPGTSYEVVVERSAGLAEACETAMPYVLGTTVTGLLTASDCVDGALRYVDRYELVTDTVISVSMSMESGDFGPFIGALDEADRFVVTQFMASPGFTRAVLAPGSYTLTPRALEAETTGWYAMTVAGATHDANVCDPSSNVFVTAGVGVTGTVTNGDCVDEFNTVDHWDRYIIYLSTGEKLTATMTADAASKLSLWSGAGHQLIEEMGAAGTLTLEFTAEAAGFHSLYVLGVPEVGYAVDFVTDPGTSLRALPSPRSSVREIETVR